MTLLDEKFGIRNNPLLHIMTFFQIFCTFTYTSLIQRFCFHVEDYPEITYGGFLWFKDLSVMDPYFILPFIQVVFSILSIYVKYLFFKLKLKDNSSFRFYLKIFRQILNPIIVILVSH